MTRDIITLDQIRFNPLEGSNDIYGLTTLAGSYIGTIGRNWDGTWFPIRNASPAGNDQPDPFSAAYAVLGVYNSRD